jgi:predicted nucleotidyltransferase
MTPELQDGVLPAGLHLCTLEEVKEAFGQFRRSDRRPQLTERLARYIQDARNSGIVSAIVIDGSYVTAKKEPGDIDLIVALRPELDLTTEMRPLEYNIQSRSMVRKLYGFDVLPAVDGSKTYQRFLDFFSRVELNDPDQKTIWEHKGMLRIEL